MPCDGDGEYSLPGASACASALPGYVPNDARDGTVLCSAGTYSPDGKGCLPCDGDGDYSPQGASTCSTAPAGFKPLQNRTGIVECPVHTYSVGASDTCLPCTNGHAPVGSASCTTTPNGHYYDEASENDLPCPPGTHSSGASTKADCLHCGNGFVSLAGSGFCDVCPPGTKSNVNNTACENCTMGEYSGVGSHVCKSCEASKFNDKPGSDSCDFCPENKESNDDLNGCRCKAGFVAVDDACECGPGHTLSRGICVLCPAGLYKSEVGNFQCTSCNLHAIEGSFSTTSSVASVLNQNASAPSSPYNCSCALGEYRVLLEEDPSLASEIGSSSNVIGKCVSCEPIEGVDCDKPGITIQTLPIQTGYWRSDDLSIAVEKCYNEDACEQLLENQPSILQAFNRSSQCRQGEREGAFCKYIEVNTIR